MPISLSRNPSYFQGIPALSVLLSVENGIIILQGNRLYKRKVENEIVCKIYSVNYPDTM